MNILRRVFLGLLLATALGAIALNIAAAFYFKPQIRSTYISPDGRFKVVVYTVPSLIAMPGQGSDAAGTAYVYDATGKELGQASFEMVQLLSLDWQENRVDLGVKSIDLPQSHDPNILLFQAVMQGDRPAFDRLLPQANLQFQTSHHRTLLHAAAVGGNLEIMRQLLKNNINVNAKDTLGDTSLQIATENNLTGIVRLLLAQRADPSVQNQAQETPLLTALESGYIDVAQQLITHGANVNVFNRNSRTPLSLAASLSHLGLIKQLLERGASVKPTHPNLGVLSAVLDNTQTSVQQKQQAIALLMANGASFQGSELLNAIRWRQLDMVEFLIKQGANINYQDGSSTLMMAIATNQDATPEQRLRIMDRLLAHGANINAKNAWGNTALAEAVLQYHPSKQYVIDYLLKHGATVNIADHNQTTPLMLAAQTPYPEVSIANRIKLINSLLKYGADIHAQNQQGKTAVDLTSDPQVQQSLRRGS